MGVEGGHCYLKDSFSFLSFFGFFFIIITEPEIVLVCRRCWDGIERTEFKGRRLLPEASLMYKTKFYIILILKENFFKIRLQQFFFLFQHILY